MLEHAHANIGTSAKPAGYWQVVSGSSYCEIVDGGRCVTDGAGSYGSRERCRVLALRPLIVHTVQYEVERKYDYLTVNGHQYKYSRPDGVKMAKGAALQWYSDGSTQRAGWKVCAQDATTTTTTTTTTKKGRYIPHSLHADPKQDTAQLASPRLTSSHLISP